MLSSAQLYSILDAFLSATELHNTLLNSFFPSLLHLSDVMHQSRFHMHDFNYSWIRHENGLTIFDVVFVQVAQYCESYRT